MTADKMPMMLDNSMGVDLNDVDDLFGDSVGLSLPVRPQNNYLLQRTDGRRRRGCCQTITWSKAGTIASITPDGQTLELRFLRSDPEQGTWDLSEPTICELVKGTAAIPLVHLEWSATANPELAVIDAVGRVAIVTFSVCLNHLFQTRKWDGDPVDDLQAIVGTHWLGVAPSNQQKPYNVLYGPAVKHNATSYQYESSFVHAGGPSHPHPSKSALVCMTIGGTLKLFWPQNNNRMEETTKELESVNCLVDLVTHAAVVSDKKFLLVALATASKQIKLLKVEIQWSGTGGQADKASLSSHTRLNPSLVDKHLASTSWLQSRSNDVDQDGHPAELSELHVLPSTLDSTGKNTASPVVVAVRSRGPNAGTYQSAQTILDRWEVVEQHQVLPPAFEQLGSRRNSVPAELPTSTILRQLDSIVLDKVLIGFEIIQFGKAVLLSFADGSVEYRNRFTFEELYTVEDTDRVMNLKQVGWSFADNGPCQQIAFSPTQCSMIQMEDDGKIRWSKLRYDSGDIGHSVQEVGYGATIAGLTVTAAPAMWYHSNYDDLLAIVKPLSTKKRFVQDWISELVRILKIQVDYSEEVQHDSLMRNTLLHSCLSIMNSLGFNGMTQPRSFQSKLASVDLTVRNIVILITLASNPPSAVKDRMSPLDEPEVVDTLTGSIKWGQSLIAWLTDSLFELVNDDRFMELLSQPRFAEMSPHLISKNEVCLHLVLSSSSRGLLQAMCKRIMYLEKMAGQANEWYMRHTNSTDPKGPVKLPNMQLQQAYRRMQQATSSSLVKVSQFEQLLNKLSSDVRGLYHNLLPAMVKSQANAPQGKQVDIAIKSAQVQFELFMLLAASPPPPFMQVIWKFLTKDVQAFRAETDPAGLFFADFDRLELQDDARSLAARAARSVEVDVFTKEEVRMSEAAQWRRCTRCAHVMEDVAITKPGMTFVLSQQRKCLCGGCWALLPRGQLFP